MRKRILLSLVAILSFYCQNLTEAAMAACGSDPPAPSMSLAWPAQGIVTNGWSLDCARDSGHRGIDIDLPKGTRVAASAPGKVIFTGFTPAEGGGLTVSIEHDGGLRTTYLHLGETMVSRGQPVEQGQLLGLSDGRPLHLGVKIVNGRESYFDPMIFLPAPAATVGNPAASEPEASLNPTLAPAPPGADASGPAMTPESPAQQVPSGNAGLAGQVSTSAAPSAEVHNAPAYQQAAVPGSIPVGVPAHSGPAAGVPLNEDTLQAVGLSQSSSFVTEGLTKTAGNSDSSAAGAGRTATTLADAAGVNRTDNLAGAIPGAGLGIAFCLLVMLTVLTGGGIGRMAAKPASC